MVLTSVLNLLNIIKVMVYDIMSGIVTSLRINARGLFKKQSEPLNPGWILNLFSSVSGLISSTPLKKSLVPTCTEYRYPYKNL